MAVSSAVNRENQMEDRTTLGELLGFEKVDTTKTKTFEAWNGDVELTRQQYIDRWVSTTHQLAYMFGKYDMSADLLEFQFKLTEVAGKEWDKH
jgi:hypothetical protein